MIVNRPLLARSTNRSISSIEVTVFQGIAAGSVTYHLGLSVTYPAGSNPLDPYYVSASFRTRTPMESPPNPDTDEIALIKY